MFPSPIYLELSRIRRDELLREASIARRVTPIRIRENGVIQALLRRWFAAHADNSAKAAAKTVRSAEST
jgi:hypothetical protein